jgi:uncharacterized membrane protein YedE/YeeE
MQDFTPLQSTLGGMLIGLSASLLLLGAGRVAGISGIFGQLFLSPGRADRRWRLSFLIGLLASAWLCAQLLPGSISPSPRSLPWLAGAGLLVGMGTRLGNGCTSGHGVCGLSRLSRRSLVATLSFMATGVLTATLLHLAAQPLPGGTP